MGRRFYKLAESPKPEISLPLEFPEYLYPPICDTEEYEARINLGKKRCKKLTLAIIGCARDIQQVIGRTIYNWELIGSLFKDYRICIFESDSNDSTLDLLHIWEKQNNKVKVLSERLNLPRLMDLSRRRMEVMATIRNKVREYTIDKLSWCDYICVADADLRGPTSIDGIYNSFGYTERWDAIFSNGLDRDEKHMYDIAILTYNGYEESDIMIEQRSGAKYATLKKGFTRPIYERGQSLVAVRSAFGGMGFYTVDAFLAGRYYNYPLDHIGFHKSLYEQEFRRLYINPSQILIR